MNIFKQSTISLAYHRVLNTLIITTKQEQNCSENHLRNVWQNYFLSDSKLVLRYAIFGSLINLKFQNQFRTKQGIFFMDFMKTSKLICSLEKKCSLKVFAFWNVYWNTCKHHSPPFIPKMGKSLNGYLKASDCRCPPDCCSPLKQREILHDC